jgi:hypothetical protein
LNQADEMEGDNIRVYKEKYTDQSIIFSDESEGVEKFINLGWWENYAIMKGNLDVSKICIKNKNQLFGSE